MLKPNIDEFFPLEAPKHFGFFDLHQFDKFDFLVGPLKSRRQGGGLLFMGENFFIVLDVNANFDEIPDYFIFFVFERLLDEMGKVFLTFSLVFFS